MEIHGYITPDAVKEELMPHQKLGLQFTASGYGSKIPTSRMARVGKKWYRIYCACYSNSGTLYIVKGGKHYVIRDGDAEVTPVMNSGYYGLR